MYTFDTETSHNDSEAWVWSWALCDEQLNTASGNGLDMLDALFSLPDGAEIWVHNLSYDGYYILWDLYRRGFVLQYDLHPGRKYHGVVSLLEDLSGIINMHVWYCGRRIVFRDSYRIFRCRLEKLPKLCGFDAAKLELDYEITRPRDHVKTPDEEAYQIADATILMRAMLWVRGQGAVGNTVGGIALNDWKEMCRRRSPFTPLTQDERNIYRSLYSGGVVHVAHAGDFRGDGRTYDCNSMYPAHSCGELPVALKDKSGRASGDPGQILHIIAYDVNLRPGGLPLIVTPFTSAGRTSIPMLDKWFYADEWAACREEYDVGQWSVVDTATFEWAPIAADYMTKWYEIKSTQPERREYAKFVLNNLTGKWGENDIHEQIRRKWFEGELCGYRYDQIDDTPNRWAFMPAVARVTSQSRLALRDAVIKSGRENLLYTDTDSVHTTGTLPPDMVDPVRLGAWKIETEFSEARYIKPKTYAERGETTVLKHAGINRDATLSRKGIDTGELVSFDNLHSGAVFWSNKQRKIKGGVIIERKEKTV